MTPRQTLIERMQKVLPLLPKNYLSGFVKRYGQYDTFKGRRSIEAVVKLVQADEPLIRLFEKYVEV